MSRFLVTGFPRFSSSAFANRALARFWAGVWACDSEKVSFAEKSLGVETHHCDGEFGDFWAETVVEIEVISL